MNLKPVLVASALAGLLATVAIRSARAQDQATSLGDLARQLKAQRAKAPVKPTKTFTNDNLPKRPAAQGLTMAGGISETPAPPSGTPAAETAGGESSGAPSGAHDEKYYRTRMAELRERLATHQRELSVLQQKMSLNETQFYTDPNKTLQQEYSRSDINKATDAVAKMQQQIADDEKAMDDLRDQLRREGGEPGWLR